jgi:hypothetical protein
VSKGEQPTTDDISAPTPFVARFLEESQVAVGAFDMVVGPYDNAACTTS